MADQSRPRSRSARALAIGLFALAMAELAGAIAAALAGNLSWANAVGSFPDGRPVGPRWRWLIWVAATDGLLFVLGFAAPGPLTAGRLVVSPYLTVPFYHRLAPLWTVGDVGWSAIIALALASLVMLWLVLAVVVVLPYAGVAWGIFNAGPVLGLLVIPLIPAAVTIAILRYQLLDIKLFVSRALVYGVLTAAAAGLYVGLVALLDELVRSRVSLGSAIAASVIIAIGFNPARLALQRLIDRALYGDRRDPVRAVSLLVGERLAGTGAAGLAGVLEALCDSLRLPFAAVRFGPAEVAAHGTAPEFLHSVGHGPGGGARGGHAAAGRADHGHPDAGAHGGGGRGGDRPRRPRRGGADAHHVRR